MRETDEPLPREILALQSGEEVRLNLIRYPHQEIYISLTKYTLCENMVIWVPNIVVVKRDGSKEPFIYEKIVVSCLKAGAPIDTARKIATVVLARLIAENKTEVTAKELTKIVLELLKKENEEWYHNWVVFDRAVKRRKTEEELKG
jgi:transcriptional regulator NrdR family protein